IGLEHRPETRPAVGGRSIERSVEQYHAGYGKHAIAGPAEAVNDAFGARRAAREDRTGTALTANLRRAIQRPTQDSQLCRGLHAVRHHLKAIDRLEAAGIGPQSVGRHDVARHGRTASGVPASRKSAAGEDRREQPYPVHLRSFDEPVTNHSHAPSPPAALPNRLLPRSSPSPSPYSLNSPYSFRSACSYET